MIDSGLTNNQQYIYTIFLKDKVGNWSSYDMYKTESRAVADTIVPNSPLNLQSIMHKGGNVKLTWTNPGVLDVDFTKIRIVRSIKDKAIEHYASGAHIVTYNITTGVEEFRDSNVSNNVLYRYSVFAGDDADQWSSFDQNNTYTEITTKTTTPQARNNFLATSLPGGNIRLTWTSPDTFGVDYNLIKIIRSDTTSILTATKNINIPSFNLTTDVNTFTDTNLLSGVIYSYTIFAKDNLDNWSPLAKSAALADGVLPAYPNNFTATTNVNGLVTLTWESPGTFNRDWKKIRIIRNDDGFAITSGNEVGASLTNIDITSTINVVTENLTHGKKYTYSIFTQDLVDNWSLYVSPNSTEDIYPDSVSPNNLINLQAAPSVNGTIQLNWTNPGTFGAGTFNEYNHITLIRSTSNIITSMNIIGLNCTTFNINTNTSNFYDDTVTKDSIQYYYSAFTRDSAGHYSLFSSPNAVATTISDAVSPNIALTFSAMPYKNASIKLNWTNPGVHNVDFSKIKIVYSTNNYLSTSNVGYSNVVTHVTDGSTEYIHEGLTHGVKYYYSLYSVDAANNWSYAKNTWVVADGEAPNPPHNFKAKTLPDGNIKLTWKNNDIYPTNFDRIRIVRSSKSKLTTINVTQSYEMIVTNNSSNISEMIDRSNLVHGTVYHYSIFAADSAENWSPFISDYQYSYALSDSESPQFLTKLNAIPSANASSVVRWDNPGNLNDDYEEIWLIRSLNAAVVTHNVTDPPHKIHLIKDGSNSFTETGLTHGATYYYSIFAKDKNGNWSNFDSDYTIASINADAVPPNNITTINAKRKTNGDIKLNWNINGQFGIDYKNVKIIRSETTAAQIHNDVSINYTTLPTFTTNKSEYIDVGLTPGKVYTYSIFNSDLANNWSTLNVNTSVASEISHIGPLEPTNFSAKAIENGGVELSWDNTGIYGEDYKVVKVIRSNNSAVTNESHYEKPNVLLATVTDGSNKLIDRGLNDNTKYFYSIFAGTTRIHNSGNWSLYYSGLTDASVTTDATAPLSPVNLSAKAQKNGNIKLSWDNVGVLGKDYSELVIIRNTYNFSTTQNILSVQSPKNHSNEIIYITTQNVTTFTDKTVKVGNKYYYSIFTKDSAGNWSDYDQKNEKTAAASSDTTMPNIPLKLATQSEFSIASTTLSYEWINNDPESDIVTALYKIGTTVSGNEVIDWTTSNYTNKIEAKNLSLLPNNTYYITVKVMNEIGLWSPEQGFTKTIIPTLTSKDVTFNITNSTKDAISSQNIVFGKVMIDIDLSKFNPDIKKEYTIYVYKKQTASSMIMLQSQSVFNNSDILVRTIKETVSESKLHKVSFGNEILQNNENYYFIVQVADDAGNLVEIKTDEYIYLTINQHEILDPYFYPNPINPAIYKGFFDFKISKTSEIELKILDLSGLTRYSYLGTHQIGPVKLSFDGRTNSGVILPNGVYIAYLSAKDLSTGEIKER